MDKPHDGGPAFPAHDYIVGDLQKDGFQKLGDTRGMSLRDYFAAHAPKMPQSWFRPRLSGEWSQCPDVPSDLFPESLRIVKNWLDDPIWDLENDLTGTERPGGIVPRDYPVLRDFVAAMRAHWAHNENLRKEEAIERFKQWPYAWADAMLKARG